MNSGAFGYVDVLKTAADASWLREEVLTNNIANVDTPNYKRQDVEFTTYLKSALEQAGTPASTLTQKVNEANLSGITTRTYTENTTLMVITWICLQRMLNWQQNRLITMR